MHKWFVSLNWLATAVAINVGWAEQREAQRLLTRVGQSFALAQLTLLMLLAQPVLPVKISLSLPQPRISEGAISLILRAGMPPHNSAGGI